MDKDPIPQNSPFNSDPKWPEGYLAILQGPHIPENRKPFYAYWVKYFFKEMLVRGKRRRDLGRPEMVTFLLRLHHNPSVAEWQVTQARKALEIYYEKFRGMALAAESQPTTAEVSETTLYPKPNYASRNPAHADQGELESIPSPPERDDYPCVN